MNRVRPPEGRSGVLAGAEGLLRILGAFPSTMYLGNPDPVAGTRNILSSLSDAKDVVTKGGTRNQSLNAALTLTPLGMTRKPSSIPSTQVTNKDVPSSRQMAPVSRPAPQRKKTPEQIEMIRELRDFLYPMPRSRRGGR